MKATLPLFICSFFFIYVHPEEIGETCKLEFFGNGTCLKLEDCDEAIDLLRNKLRPTNCGFLKNKPLVCCENPDRKFNKVRLYCLPEFKFGLAGYGNSISPIGVGGFNSLSQEFPHMSALGYGEEDDVTWGCGGTLISPEFVLTAAHCLNSRSLGKVKYVRLGDLNLKRNDDIASPQNFTVKQTYKHPDYRPPNQYNDIALIKLDRQAEINSFVRPACLNTDPKKNVTYLVATGWGQLGIGAELAEHLQKMFIQLVPENICKNAYAKHTGSRRLPNGIIETQICAGAPKIDTCAGDSGGPLQKLYTHEIFGVTSFGIACGISSNPGVYTRVASYIDWIDSIVWPNKDNFYEALN